MRLAPDPVDQLVCEAGAVLVMLQALPPELWWLQQATADRFDRLCCAIDDVRNGFVSGC